MKRPVIPTTESDVQQEIQLAGPGLGSILERNNSGALLDQEGRPVRFGLGNVSKQHNENMKSSDLVGGTMITITSDMIGKTVLVLTAVEVKEPGWKYKGDKREVAQNNWIQWIRNRGGIGTFAQSVDDFKHALNQYVEWLKS